MAGVSASSVESAAPTPFPAKTKQISKTIDDTSTDFTGIAFTDKIVITVSQEGRIGHWIHVPLSSADPTISSLEASSTRNTFPTLADGLPNDDASAEAKVLPLPHLTATTILGAGSSARDTIGQLIATQVGSLIVRKAATQQRMEERLLVMGLGLKEAEIETDEFREIVMTATSMI